MDHERQNQITLFIERSRRREHPEIMKVFLRRIDGVGNISKVAEILESCRNEKSVLVKQHERSLLDPALEYCNT